jgi:hypothetical protein
MSDAPKDLTDERLAELTGQLLVEFAGWAGFRERPAMSFTHWLVVQLQRRRASDRWIPWKPGDALPAKGWYWTTQDDGVATVCEMLANGWRSGAWKVIAYLPRPLPAPFDSSIAASKEGE